MKSADIEKLAKELLNGRIPIDDFVRRLTRPATADLDEAQIDLQRSQRCGFPEVIYAEGKSLPTLEKIFNAMLQHGENILATRVSDEQAAALTKLFPEANHNELGHTFRIDAATATQSTMESAGIVAIVAAGTSDLTVAEEARETADWTGAEVRKIYDVGVAGPHRLHERLPEIVDANAVVVVAGMEGALPSVVGGHVACPVIGVPTSVGYGTSFAGLAALLGMLNSCAANVTVVNIDAGFKAGYLAGLIARQTASAACRTAESQAWTP